MIFGEKIEVKVYVNDHDFVSDVQTPSMLHAHDFFCVFFMIYYNAFHNYFSNRSITFNSFTLDGFCFVFQHHCRGHFDRCFDRSDHNYCCPEGIHG